MASKQKVDSMPGKVLVIKQNSKIGSPSCCILTSLQSLIIISRVTYAIINTEHITIHSFRDKLENARVALVGRASEVLGKC